MKPCHKTLSALWVWVSVCVCGMCVCVCGGVGVHRPLVASPDKRIVMPSVHDALFVKLNKVLDGDLRRHMTIYLDGEDSQRHAGIEVFLHPNGLLLVNKKKSMPLVGLNETKRETPGSVLSPVPRNY